MKNQTPKIFFSSALLVGSCLFLILNLGSCGSKDTYLFWSDGLVGVISGAVWASQGKGNFQGSVLRGGDSLPASTVECPELINAEDNLADCLEFSNDKITTNPGANLRRYFGLCQFPGLKRSPWWRTYHRIQFPSQAVCEAIRGSSGGLTTANIASNSLVGQTIKINFGLGANADEQNIFFSQKGLVQYLWTDFPTGFLESKIGGMDVTFTAANERKINIQGVQVKNFIPNNEEINNPVDLYVDIASLGAGQVLKLISDKTISSIEAGDRMFERTEADLDFQWGESHPMVVKFSGTTPVILAGGKIRTQYNSKGSLSLTTISEDLRFEDPNCCWPTQGKITTQFNTLYVLPTVRRKNFDTEEVVFKSTCGEVSLIQSGASAGDEIGERPITLDQCF